MKPETEKQIYESFREALREILNPIIEAADRMTDEPGGQAAAMRDIANGCSPLANCAALNRLCEKLEQLIDGRVSGSFTKALDHHIKILHGTFEKLGKACNAYAGFLEPYAGMGGTMRLALETGTQPWNIIMGFVGKHPYQVKRAELETDQQAAFEAFTDALLSMILAFESAVSNHTGRHFSFREAYHRTVAAPASSSKM